jgi:hypothetical protein
MKIVLRERRLQTVEDIITNTTAELRAIQQTSIEQFSALLLKEIVLSN